MKKYITQIFAFFVLFFVSSLEAQVKYFPERNANWEEKAPTDLKIDSEWLNDAVKFAEANEYSGSRDLRIAIVKSFAREPFHQILGPTKKRGGPAGMILKDGYVVAKWGDTKRVDMTFSVTKSFLSTMAGLAVDKGLIKNETDLAKDYVWDGTFGGAHILKLHFNIYCNKIQIGLVNFGEEKIGQIVHHVKEI